MKVKFLETMGGKDFTYQVGEVYDLKKEVPQRYVDHGICEKVVEVKAKRKNKK